MKLIWELTFSLVQHWKMALQREITGLKTLSKLMISALRITAFMAMIGIW